MIFFLLSSQFDCEIESCLGVFSNAVLDTEDILVQIPNLLISYSFNTKGKVKLWSLKVLQLQHVLEYLQNCSICVCLYICKILHIMYTYVIKSCFIYLFIFLVMPSSATCNAQNVWQTSLKLFNKIMCMRKQSSKWAWVSEVLSK